MVSNNTTESPGSRPRLPHGFFRCASIWSQPIPLNAPLAADLRPSPERSGGVGDAPPAPIESGLYFAVAECLANAAKHAEPTAAWIELEHAEQLLRVVVGDDGHGGADPGAGTGLRGVARRLAAFDGTMRVSSPTGGPTVVTLEVPCDLASSSPRTTPSSEPA